ncbi:CIA30-domain-containing protein [Glonium stellatum]|uniref:CIA30-domain-containing protein n=1 Tax=Glonium stellatum TaxID=574774 RepID=A0A8E2EY39_9PEZI|nr:CIA30-domain-containing protein [Glonium stellatum]
MTKKEFCLFGGDKSWSPEDWTASDDRVRGGKSQSYLDCSSSESSAWFHGQLDIKTLGGAGFASQRTTGNNQSWDLSCYNGIRLEIGEADKKRYTFIIKDELLPKNPENGREQSTISYEYDFIIPSGNAYNKGTFIFIPWKEFKATYRGKEKKDAPALNCKKIKRFSIMMRSFFGDQEGPFSLTITSIKAILLLSDPEKCLLETSDIYEDCVATTHGPKMSVRQPQWPVLILGLATGCLLFYNIVYPWFVKQSCRL